MMSSHDPLIKQLTEILGLPRHLKRFTLTAAVDEPVTVTVECECYPDSDGRKLPNTVTYRLVPAGPGTASGDVGYALPAPGAER